MHAMIPTLKLCPLYTQTEERVLIMKTNICKEELEQAGLLNWSLLCPYNYILFNQS